MKCFECDFFSLSRFLTAHRPLNECPSSQPAPCFVFNLTTESRNNRKKQCHRERDVNEKFRVKNYCIFWLSTKSARNDEIKCRNLFLELGKIISAVAWFLFCPSSPSSQLFFALVSAPLFPHRASSLLLPPSFPSPSLLSFFFFRPLRRNRLLLRRIQNNNRRESRRAV